MVNKVNEITTETPGGRL